MARPRPPSRATLTEAADGLRRLLAAVDAGELEAKPGHEIALLRRLQGVLAGWETALGEQSSRADQIPRCTIDLGTT